MGLFDKIKEPIFLKEDSSAEAQLLALQKLSETASGSMPEQIKREFKYVEAGIFGSCITVI